VNSQQVWVLVESLQNRTFVLSLVCREMTYHGGTMGMFFEGRLVKGEIGAEISKLKGQPGKDMVIFGSGSIVSTLTTLGLIDEYRILVAPVVLGSGIPLFKGLAKPVNLKLLRTKTFKSGVVLLYYGPERK